MTGTGTATYLEILNLLAKSASHSAVFLFHNKWENNRIRGACWWSGLNLPGWGKQPMQCPPVSKDMQKNGREGKQAATAVHSHRGSFPAFGGLARIGAGPAGNACTDVGSLRLALNTGTPARCRRRVSASAWCPRPLRPPLWSLETVRRVRSLIWIWSEKGSTTNSTRPLRCSSNNACRKQRTSRGRGVSDSSVDWKDQCLCSMFSVKLPFSCLRMVIQSMLTTVFLHSCWTARKIAAPVLYRQQCSLTMGSHFSEQKLLLVLLSWFMI
jgi:hypothetical protein